MPNVRTATIAVSSKRMTGRSLARTISQPDVAVRAIPEVVAIPPSSPAPTIAQARAVFFRVEPIPGPAPEAPRWPAVVMREPRPGVQPGVGPGGCAHRRERAVRPGG